MRELTIVVFALKSGGYKCYGIVPYVCGLIPPVPRLIAAIVLYCVLPWETSEENLLWYLRDFVIDKFLSQIYLENFFFVFTSSWCYYKRFHFMSYWCSLCLARGSYVTVWALIYFIIIIIFCVRILLYLLYIRLGLYWVEFSSSCSTVCTWLVQKVESKVIIVCSFCLVLEV